MAIISNFPCLPNLIVNTVNGKTGTVVLSAGDVGAATTSAVQTAQSTADTANTNAATALSTANSAATAAANAQSAVANKADKDSVVYHTDEETGEPIPLDADTLGGHSASYFASQSDLNELQTTIEDNVLGQVDSLTSEKMSAVFHVGTSAPSDKRLLWIDTNTSGGGLKYHNGSAWVNIPIIIPVVSADPSSAANGQAWILDT